MGGGEELTRKIFRSILTVGVAVLACSLLLVMGCFYSFYEGHAGARSSATSCASPPPRVETRRRRPIWKRSSPASYRLTWIAADGTVLYDTQADAAQMENHARARGGPARRWRPARAARAATSRRCCEKTDLQREPPHGRHRAAPVRQPRHDAARCCSAAFQPILLVADRAACALEPAREPSGQAHRRAAQRARPRASAGKRRLRGALSAPAAASTASADRSTPSSRELRQKTDEFTQITAEHARGARAARRKGRGAEHQPRRADALRRGRARASGRIS